MSASDTSDINKRIEELSKTIPRLHWGRLRFIGSLRSLSVSFVIGLVLALPELIGTNIKEYIKTPQVLWPMVIFVIGIGLAYLSYEIFCPVIIKKFHSLADFYQHQLGIKKLQIETYPDDPYKADLVHVSEHYIKLLSQKTVARWVTAMFYVVGFLSLLYLLISFYQSI